jgi:hypothetical protein
MVSRSKQAKKYVSTCIYLPYLFLRGVTTDAARAAPLLSACPTLTTSLHLPASKLFNFAINKTTFMATSLTTEITPP